MTVWPILVQHWQIDCCGERFSIADEVAWTLSLRPYAEADGWPGAMSVDLVPSGHRVVADGMERPWLVITVDGIEISTGASIPADGEHLQGMLIEEHHGPVPEDLTVTRGVVRRIRVVSQEFRRDRGAWLPVPSGTTLRDVDSVPPAFRREMNALGSRVNEVGVLADLELAGSGHTALLERRLAAPSDSTGASAARGLARRRQRLVRSTRRCARSVASLRQSGR